MTGLLFPLLQLLYIFYSAKKKTDKKTLNNMIEKEIEVDEQELSYYNHRHLFSLVLTSYAFTCAVLPFQYNFLKNI